MKQRVERRLAAIVSADLTGYGLMMEADEEAAHLRTGALMGEVVQQAEAFGGSVINVAGDGVLSEFPSPVNAVRFSLAVLRVSQQHNKRRPRQKALAFRVGVHAGDIVVDDGRIGGDNINIAVRIEQVAEPQSVLVSGAVYEQVRRTLPVAFEYVGQPQLKHVSRPIELYRVLGGRKAAATLAGKTRAPVRLATATGPSIAVLPFENLNPDRDNGFFIDGITDDIITALSRFRSLSVIGRESSFKFRSEQLTPSEVAKRLGVRYLLSGSIRSADHRIRLNAQLVDTSLGRTVWAERYDSTLSDLLGIEAGVVQMIVARLAGQVEGAERARLRSEETSDLEAYGYQLRGEELLWSATQKSNLLARKQFQLALRRDPNYARAYAGLSRTHNLDWRYSWVPDRAAALETAVELAKVAVEKDPIDARGHAELAFAFLYQKYIGLSVHEYRVALELNPNDADVMADYADALVYAKRPEEAIEWMGRAMHLNPICPDRYYWHLADAYSALGRYEDVVATILMMRDPRQCSRMLAASFAHLGRLEEARLYAAEVLNRQPGFRISEWASVVPRGPSPELDRYLAGLRKAGLPE